MSAPRIVIAVFAKTIGLSPVKTRLAKDIGQHGAEKFYQYSINCTVACLQALSENNSLIDHVWVIAEEEGGEHPQWQGMHTQWTGSGGLGARLHHVYKLLQHQYDIVILIGSDCPQLPQSIIQQAIDHLIIQPNDMVLGPAEDGGFYLFAGCSPIDEAIWLSTPYSQNNTADELTRQIPNDIYYLPVQFDIDTVEQLRRLPRGHLFISS